MRGKLELPLGTAWGNDQLRIPVHAGNAVYAMFLRENP